MRFTRAVDDFVLLSSGNEQSDNGEFFVVVIT